MNPDRVFATAAFAASGGYLAAALSIASPAGGYDLVGPRTFPLAIGAALAASALWMGYGAGRAVDPVAGSADEQDNGRRTPRRTGRAADPAAMDWRAAGVSALVFLAYLACLVPLGYPVATAAFIVAESRALGSRAWRRDLLGGVVISAAAYLGFRLLLGIRLPAGPFELLLGMHLPAEPLALVGSRCAPGSPSCPASMHLPAEPLALVGLS